MIDNQNHIYTHLRRIALTLMALIAICAPSAKGFNLSTYTERSALAEGRWVKVSVTETGMHLITADNLRAWGFSDPSKVRVYGYGGQRLPDYLIRSSFIDDLPQLQSVTTSRGLYFYAQGVVSWTSPSTGRYKQNLNPFTTKGYYYLSDKPATDRAIKVEGSTSVGPDDPVATTFNARVYHEVDEYSPGMTGHYMLGEDFKYTPTRTFTLDLTDRDPEASNIWMQTGFMARTYGSSSKLKFTVNNTQLPEVSEDIIKPTVNSSYNHGEQTAPKRDFKMSGDRLNITIAHTSPVTVQDARLDYITVNYRRHIKLRDGKLLFWSKTPAMTIAGAKTSTRVWDVTNPLEIVALPTVAVANGIRCVSDYSNERAYAAWNEDGTFPTPVYEGPVANQNLHAQPVPDMVIFAHRNWISEAERLAEYHRTSGDPLKVLVVNVEDVYNEFSSGSPDVNAFRKMLKMFWDRGNNAGADAVKLRYALLMGRAFTDNRKLTTDGKNLGFPILPTWESDDGLTDNSSFTTDDILAMLTDGSGSSLSSDQLNIAVGRMPVRSLSDAKSAVDKLFRYHSSMPAGNWKNRIMMIADDEDSGQHMSQTENFYKNMRESVTGDDFFYDKVYIDAYKKINNNYPDARNRIFRLLDEGVWFWTYVGHASMTGWTHENLLTSKDINNMYYKRYPILYAATCDFLRWDESSLSGAEIMWHTPNGGVIAMISATRPVFINDNGYLTYTLGLELGRRDDQGRLMRLGDVYRNIKNNLQDAKNKFSNNSNRLRFVLMGDPAMVMGMPSNLARVNKINGAAVSSDNPPTIMACQDMVIEGEIVDGLGKPLNDFNGQVYVTIHDAEHTTLTRCNGDNPPNSPFVFDEQGSRLYAGAANVANGKFTIKAVMPAEIADNYRPGAINMYANSTDKREAAGCFRDVYFYGYDDNATVDNEPPVIESFVLNHDGFKSGDNVNESPTVLATVTDNRGINLSLSGIGHQMSLTLDGSKTYNDVSEYYTPAYDGTIGGSLVYPIEGLSSGNHELTLRVWDTSNNLTESTIAFNVQQGLAPNILDVYTDANPASVEANFYVKHDRPDANVTLTITVYNMLGAEVWSSTASGRSDMFQSVPVKWNLLDKAGHRVGRGIYLYRATISADSEEYSSATRRLAVTGM